MEGTGKVAEFARPYFDNLRTFVKDNQQPLTVAAVAFTIGAIATAIITSVFCRSTNTSPPETSSTTATP
jgi:hypothetical protein